MDGWACPTWADYRNDSGPNLFTFRAAASCTVSAEDQLAVAHTFSTLAVFTIEFRRPQLPSTIFDQAPVFAIIVVESIAIGVSEELTFRFSLHRLWSQYSSTSYVVGSALIFGILHIPIGTEVATRSLFGVPRVVGPAAVPPGAEGQLAGRQLGDQDAPAASSRRPRWHPRQSPVE